MAAEASLKKTNGQTGRKTEKNLKKGSIPENANASKLAKLSPLDQVKALFDAFAISDPMQYVDAKYVIFNYKLNLRAAEEDGQGEEYSAIRRARGIGFYERMLKEQRAAFRTLALHGERVALLADENGFDGQPILRYLERYTGDRRYRRPHDSQEETRLVEKIRVVLRLLRAKLHSVALNGGVSSGQADRKTDKSRKKVSIPQDAGRLTRLARKMKKALEKPGVRKIDVALEFNDFNKKKAQKDLRALRRHPRLLE